MAVQEDVAEDRDISDADVADIDGDDRSIDVDDEHSGEDRSSAKRRVRRVSVSVRALLLAALVTSLAAAVVVMAWLYLGARNQVNADARQAADNSHAEQIALHYAVDAAVMDFQKMDVWKKNLVQGTTPQLTDKLTKAATAMEQILAPLQWTSTAKPLAAKVRSNANGVYVVDAFVSVMTKTVQAPDSLQSTATYAVTIDRNQNWQISDVGGIAAVVGGN